MQESRPLASLEQLKILTRLDPSSYHKKDRLGQFHSPHHSLPLTPSSWLTLQLAQRPQALGSEPASWVLYKLESQSAGLGAGTELSP